MNNQLIYILANKIDNELMKADVPVTIAIDGPCASGKTSLATWLKIKYECNVFSMDDFFLQPHMRKEERYAEAGGNVDYERFYQEVLVHLKRNEDFEYRVFDCGIMDFSHKVSVIPRRLNIVEGVYSMHPALIENYDYKIFLSINQAEQISRILKRNGPEMLQRFTELWIPLENNYFNTFKIKERSDLVWENW